MGQQHQESWGRYQAGTSVLMALLKMPAAWFQLSLLFLAPDVSFWCSDSSKQSLMMNDSIEIGAEEWNDTCSFLDKDGDVQTCTQFQYCSQYFVHTVNTQWDLVCEREWLVTWAQMALMSGVSFGNFVGGLLADRVGRKPVLVAGVLLQPVMSVLVALVPTFPLFVLFRFLTGFALGNTMVISFVLGAELLNDKWRPIISILHQVPFGMGQTLLAVTAYYFSEDWRYVQVALSVYSLIFLPYCWLVEESPKWLVAKGHFQRAQQVAKAISRRNGLSPPSASEIHPMTEKFEPQIVKTEKNKVVNNTRVEDPVVGFCDLFRTPRLRYYTLSVWLMWYCAGLSFFALNAYQPAMGSSPFINIGLGGLIGGIPGNILTIFLVRRFGRKRVIIVAHLLVSIISIHIPTVDVGESWEDWQRRLLGLLSFIAMSVAYPALFLMSAELLPTVLRGSAMGVANLMGRLGNTTAPLVGPMGVISKWLPLSIIAAAPLITAVIMLTLPDTWNKPLPVTVQDVESQTRVAEAKEIKMEEDGRIYNPVIVVEQIS